LDGGTGTQRIDPEQRVYMIQKIVRAYHTRPKPKKILNESGERTTGMVRVCHGTLIRNRPLKNHPEIYHINCPTRSDSRRAPNNLTYQKVTRVKQGNHESSSACFHLHQNTSIQASFGRTRRSGLASEQNRSHPQLRKREIPLLIITQIFRIPSSKSKETIKTIFTVKPH